jgi:hypothetical protein
LAFQRRGFEGQGSPGAEVGAFNSTRRVLLLQEKRRARAAATEDFPEPPFPLTKRSRLGERRLGLAEERLDIRRKRRQMTTYTGYARNQLCL